MEISRPVEELRTQRAWNLQRKILKAERAYRDSTLSEDVLASQRLDDQLEKLRAALSLEYHANALLLSVENPNCNMEAIIRDVSEEHRDQMKFSLRIHGSIKDEESFDVID